MPSVKSAAAHALVLLAAAAACGGDAPGPVPDTFVAVGAGSYFTCALSRLERAFCWGTGLRGELGADTTHVSLTPIPVAGRHRFRALTVGVSHACALTADGAAWCWGANAARQLGAESGACIPEIPVETCSAVPQRVDGTSRYRALSAGNLVTCGITVAGRLHCWGTGAALLRRVGTGTLPPTAMDGDSVSYAALSVGESHGCAITSTSELRCWGFPGGGVLGRGTSVFSCDVPCNGAPLPVAGNMQWRAVAAGTDHTCALDMDGKAWCWGVNDRGLTGHGDSSVNQLLPVAVAGGRTYIAIAAASQHSCAVDDAGTAWCWGIDAEGRLGNISMPSLPCEFGSALCHRQPVPVEPVDDGYTRIVAGPRTSCGITGFGDVWCWGRGNSGEIGNGSRAMARAPVRILRSFVL